MKNTRSREFFKMYMSAHFPNRTNFSWSMSEKSTLSIFDLLRALPVGLLLAAPFSIEGICDASALLHSYGISHSSLM